MPTGYTAAVVDGTITDLAPFALQLARGMGACIMMCEDPWDKPIPERFEPGMYNAERLAEAMAERDRLLALTPAERQTAADEAFNAAAEAKAKYFAEKAEQRERYRAMIAKVEAWEGAPEGIKEFALQQLRDGMEFDCREPTQYWDEPAQMTGAEWLADQLEKNQRDIAYHTKADNEERARTDGRNAWLAQLRASLADA